MNQKQRFAIVLLVVAIVLLLTSLVIGISVDLAKDKIGGEKVLSTSSSKGEVTLEVIRAPAVIGGVLNYGSG